MTELLSEMEQTLADVLQSGLGAAAPGALEHLAKKCESRGLHTGSALMGGIAAGLAARSHTIGKDDRRILEAISRGARYIQLCREKLQEETIARRWQEKGGEP